LSGGSPIESPCPLMGGIGPVLSAVEGVRVLFSTFDKLRANGFRLVRSEPFGRLRACPEFIEGTGLSNHEWLKLIVGFWGKDTFRTSLPHLRKGESR